MFQFASFFRGSKATGGKVDTTGINSVTIPRSLEINIDAAEGEDEFLEITTRRKTYLEVAKEAFQRQPKDGSSKVNGVLSLKKPADESKSGKSKDAVHELEDELTYSANLDDLDAANYDLKKSNRHVLKSKNKKTPAYYKELKVKKSPLAGKKFENVALLTS